MSVHSGELVYSLAVQKAGKALNQRVEVGFMESRGRSQSLCTFWLVMAIYGAVLLVVGRVMWAMVMARLPFLIGMIVM